LTRFAALGVDAGSTTVKVVAIDGSAAIIWSALEPTEPRCQQQLRRLLDDALAAGAGSSGVPKVATGYGRKLVPAADRVVTEISCHAKGVFRRLGHGGTLFDIGGQDSKVIAIRDSGQVLNFVMNDKCAAGTGRFLEVTASRLRVPVERMGATALSTAHEVQVSNTCTVFAESEIISLIAQGEALEPIVRGLHRSLVARIVSLGRSLRPRPPFIASGGVARNDAVRAFLAEALGDEVLLPEDPQLMGAYGAALVGLEARPAQDRVSR
jgi:predicted CoA-substrate-specific enzyme activase